MRRKYLVFNVTNLFFLYFSTLFVTGVQKFYNKYRVLTKQLTCFALVYLIATPVWSQATSLFYNNGASIYLTPGAYMIVNNDSLHNYQGLIQNAGDLRVAGDIYNDATATLTGSPSTATGLYDIGGNWVNSGTVTSYQDSVLLSGNNQLITGTQVTPFYDLILAGVTGSVKSQTINATVSGILDLRDHELATQQYEMLVLNTATTAITQANPNTGSGYVSSITTGRLSRATNLPTAYFFPVGIPSDSVSLSYPFYYRPIDITPTSATANIYGARLADNPTNDTYDVLKFDDSLCSVNPHFYHRLYHSSGGNTADIKMYFDPIIDGAWTDMAHWNTPLSSKWNYMGLPTAGSGYGFSSVEIHNWSNFTPSPFALASRRFSVTLGPNQELYPNQSVNLNANISAINIDSIRWVPDLYLNDNTIADPIATPAQTTEYTIIVVNSLGCRVEDSVKLTILPDVLLIPTAFSPNMDGHNDYFRPLNKNLVSIDFQVYDRWGVKVFETDIIGDGWDGTYRGLKQDLGVYVWQAEYKLKDINKTFTANGNVTLVR
jgi:gliding motility-associated-like protein